MYLERPEEYKKQVETQFYKGIREILKPALNELNESSNGRLPTFINLENYDFVSEGNDFLYPVQKGRWLGHGIPSKIKDTMNAADLELYIDEKRTIYRLTHHFKTINGWGGIALINKTEECRNEDWIYGYVIDKQMVTRPADLPPPYNETKSLALSYVTALQGCHFLKRHSYTSADGVERDYYRCSYDKPTSTADGKIRKSKKEKETAPCSFSFIITKNSTNQIGIVVKNDNHEHDFSNYYPSYILPSMKEFIVENFKRPLCFIKKNEIVDLQLKFNFTYPELERWDFNTADQLYRYCHNQTSSLFDNEISEGSNILNVIHSYNLLNGRWGMLGGTEFKSAVTMMPNGSAIQWVGVFMDYDLIPILSEMSNNQLFFDGTYGCSSIKTEIKRHKADLYLLTIQTPDFVYILAAFLSLSDTCAAVLEGLDKIFELFKDAGINLLDYFSLFMSDNQSGLHSAVQKRYQLIALSCFWHISDAWNRKLAKLSSPYSEDEILQIQDTIRLGKKAITESVDFFILFSGFGIRKFQIKKIIKCLHIF